MEGIETGAEDPPPGTLPPDALPAGVLGAETGVEGTAGVGEAGEVGETGETGVEGIGAGGGEGKGEGEGAGGAGGGRGAGGGGGGVGTGTEGTDTLTDGKETEIVGTGTCPTACAQSTPAITPPASSAAKPAPDLTFVPTIPCLENAKRLRRGTR